tara:strand:+ start:1688 stop:2854 length:1167 start_codon:yes stop_codon:yes gene_type:complete
MKITIVGSGYVGMSLGVLLSQKNNVTILDIDSERVDKINRKITTVKDSEITNYLKNKKLSLNATTSTNDAYTDADYIIIATPTNYDANKNQFDTSSVDGPINDAIKINNNALIVIKSTIPVGHTEKLKKNLLHEKIVFSPEFLREGSALKDNLYPSRIIVGGECRQSKEFASIMKSSSKAKDIQMLFMSSTEAEAVKLFANTFLALRVAYFNELDSYALFNSLNSKNIINGVCADNRIGNFYNNPSFGYGGYCLPKDTKQLLASFQDVPQDLIKAVIDSNMTRKNFLSQIILEKNPNVVGFYRLIMKAGSDNFRSSAIKDLIRKVKDNNIKVILYEPSLNPTGFDEVEICNDLIKFKESSDCIVANRKSTLLDDVKHKVFTRDIFGNN